jgi:hypothetical protein
MTRPLCVAFSAALFLAATAQADVVVPNSAAGVEGDGTFSLTSTGAAGRTFQLNIEEGQLTSLVGQQIMGLQWRLNAAATAAWPPTGTNYAFWDIFVGPGVDPSAMSNTFASNFTAAATQVRAGALAFNAGGWSFGGSPNAFGPTLNFDTPYLYTGGDLTIEMRFAAQTGATTQSPFDAILASGGPANGWGVNFNGRWTSNAAGTTGANANFLVTNLVTVPEPTSMLLVGVPLAAAAWRKLRRRS